MAPRRSAGILLFRRMDSGPGGGGLEVLLVHPGGPFWARKDEGAWSIPKGEYGQEGDDPDEEPLDAALREFEEEVGQPAPAGERIDLGTLKQPGGKFVTAWGVEGTLDADQIVSNSFELEWPPRSGKFTTFPEVDRAAWLDVPAARAKILRGQAGFLDRLVAALDGDGDAPST
jgi:predicted NUDIX family NTP pyrophosphohydrolase